MIINFSSVEDEMNFKENVFIELKERCLQKSIAGIQMW